MTEWDGDDRGRAGSGTFDDVRLRLLERSARRASTGAQVYVSRDGVRLFTCAIGEAAPGIPMTSDSVVYLSCAGKPLLATAVGRLVDEGLIAFDDPVCRHLPEFADGGKAEVTIEQVLNHAGGFRFFDGPGPYREPFEVVAGRAVAASLESGWRPGVDQGYHSETAWHVLAVLLESKRARDYGDVIEEEVLSPLGLDSIWATMTAAVYHDVRPRLAVPSYVTHLGIRRFPYLISGSACQAKCPCWGYYAPMNQLGRFYETALDALHGDRSFPVSKQTLGLMAGPFHGPRWDRTWKRDTEYGRGFLRDLRTRLYGDRWSPSSFGHGGTHAMVYAGADPETGVVIAASFGALVDDLADVRALMDGLHNAALNEISGCGATA
jgi:CubicO group peptidase (beta-lactamase class C family)